MNTTTPEEMIEDLRAEVADLESELNEADRRIADLEDQLAEARTQEEVEEALVEGERRVIEERYAGLTELAEEAHSLLADLAWRAVNNDPAAIATEQQAGAILKRLREYA